MFDGRFRHAVDRSTKPVGKALVRVGVTADVLTVFGLAMSVVAAFVIGSGRFLLAILMLFAVGLPDLFDGPVAKASGRASARGAFFDSVADRVSDAFLYGGVAWYLVARHHGETAMIPVAILAVTSLISYERAKAEVLGISAKGGLMERAERFVLLGGCFVAAAVSQAALVPALFVFLGLVTLTAAGRFVRVWQLAEGPAPLREAPNPLAARWSDRRRRIAMARRRELRSDSRWRSWREARAQRQGALSGPLVPLGHRRMTDPHSRALLRRSGTPGASAVRTWRDRRAARLRDRVGRRSDSSGA